MPVTSVVSPAVEPHYLAMLPEIQKFAYLRHRHLAYDECQEAKDDTKYPLACRIFDLTDGCGSVMYGRTKESRSIYTCGRYMRTDNAECANNTVDGDATLRFVLKTIRQIIHLHGGRSRIEELLRERAKLAVDAQPPMERTRLELMVVQREKLKGEVALVQRRMASESDDRIYAALREEFMAKQDELRQLDLHLEERSRAEQPPAVQDAEGQVNAALALLDDVERICSIAEARGEINPMLVKLGMRLGLNFTGVIKGKKRSVRKLANGIMVFGDHDLPVPIHGKDRIGPAGGNGHDGECGS
jgi:hypothetical protein